MSTDMRRSHRTRVALLLAAALVRAGAARAQTTTAGAADPGPAEIENIEELDLSLLLSTPEDVWTASKTEQKNYEAPAIITTVTREQIAVWGYRSLAELLGHLLGFYVVDDHVTPNLAVRGISGGLHADSSIVKVLIDGHSVAFHSTGGNWLGPELVPLSAVERIEIVRGPASALFGADAFLGVINIKTRTGKSLSGAAAWLALGSGWRELAPDGHKLATDVDVSAGFERGNLDVLVAARRSSQDLSGLELPDSSPAPSIPVYNKSREAHGLDQESLSALVRVGYRPRQGTQLGAFGYFSSLRRGAEFGSLYQLVNGRSADQIFSENRVALAQLRVGLLLEQALGSQLRLSARGSASRGAPGKDDRLELGSDFYYVRREFSFRALDLDAQLEWRPASQALRPLRLVAGASAFIDDEQLPSRIVVAKQETQQDRPGDVIEAVSVRQGRKTFLNAGAYLHGLWDALPQLLSLTGGLRYDQHNVYGAQLSNRIGVVSTPVHGLHTKLLYGTAFKAPSPLLLHATPSAIGDVVGNPGLKPQYVRTLELQAAWEPAESLSLTSNVAYSVVSDKTEFVQQGIDQVARNVARAATVSWETMLEYRYKGLVRSQLSLELQRTRRNTGQVGYTGAVLGERGGIYPNAMLHGGLVVQPPRLPVRGTAQASYVGPRRPSDTNILLNGGAYRLPWYVLLDAGLATRSFDLLSRQRYDVSFALTGKNLLGTAGPTPGFSGVDYPLPGRTVFLQMNLGL
jgi:outer membrane receptor for ferrienterochelin and colicins